MSEEEPFGIELDEPSAGVGARLKGAREAAGLDLARVAAETRIPQRHLVTIEEGSLSDLPARTYAIGFSRTYARLLGLDEQEIIDQVRGELAEGSQRAGTPAKFEPGDPARVPGRALAWFALFAAVLLLAGIFAFYRSYFAPGLGPAPLRDDSEQLATNGAEKPSAAPAQRTGPEASGPVVFTSEMDGTWVKFYDAGGNRLFEAQMDRGQSYTVPGDADGPQIWTGRPYALTITIGGKEIPKLSEADEIVKDVPVTAEALLTRADRREGPSSAPTPSATSG